MARAKPKPKVITLEETHRRPLWEFSKGMNTYMRVSTEMDGARNVIQGWCEHAPDLEPMIWDQANWDEIFFCAKGSLKVLAEDRDGNKMELVAKEHETMFLPAGFKYTYPEVQLTGVGSSEGTLTTHTHHVFSTT